MASDKPPLPRPNILHSSLLRIFHVIYFLYTSLWTSTRPRRTRLPTGTRTKHPAHLSLMLIKSDTSSEEENKNAYLESVRDVTKWCLDAGVTTFSVFDRYGDLSECSTTSSAVTLPSEQSSFNEKKDGSWLPPTPPPSERSNSRPRSPHEKEDQEEEESPYSAASLRITHNSEFLGGRFFNSKESSPDTPSLTLYIISPTHSKAALVSATHSLLASHHEQDPFSLPLSKLHKMMETTHGFPSPDLLVIHHLSGKREPIKLWGYPPWQSHLTEIHQTNRRPQSLWTFLLSRKQTVAHSISLEAFNAALDEFGTAQMRLGT